MCVSYHLFSRSYMHVIFLLTIIATICYGCPPPNGGDNMRNPEDCSTYIACPVGSSQGIVMPCKQGLCYNELINECDYCTNVPGCECTPSLGMTLPAFIKYAWDCDKFFFCREDGSYGGSASCARGLWFHPDKLACDIPWTDKCPFYCDYSSIPFCEIAAID